MVVIEMNAHAVQYRQSVSRSYVIHRPAPSIDRKEVTAMHCMLVGMVFSLSCFPLAVSYADPNTAIARDLIWCLAGGVLGALICHWAWDAKSIKTMSGDAFGNLCVSLAFGPQATASLANYLEVEVHPRMLITVSAMLGIVGLLVVREVLPRCLRALSIALPKIITRSISGDDNKSDEG